MLGRWASRGLQELTVSGLMSTRTHEPIDVVIKKTMSGRIEKARPRMDHGGLFHESEPDSSRSVIASERNDPYWLPVCSGPDAMVSL